MARRRSTGFGHLLVFGLLLIFAIGGGMASMSGIMPEYSTGYRSGYLQKASKKGFINKSFEGQLVLKGFTSRSKTSSDKNTQTTTNSLTNTWLFSATDPKVMDQLVNAAGKNVTLHYKQWFWRPVFKQATQYTIYKVQVNN